MTATPMNDMQQILDAAREKSKDRKRKIVVVAAHNADIMEAAIEIEKEEIADIILIGDKDEMDKIVEERGFDMSLVEIIDEKDHAEAAKLATQLVKDKKADLLMKGVLPTSTFIKAVLNPEMELRVKGSILSHIAVLQFPDREKFYYFTDAGICMYPDVEQKKRIIQNAVEVAHALGNVCPKVALLSAIEYVNPKMKSTGEALEVQKLFEKEGIKDCIVQGPLALDDAVSMKVAKEKGVEGDVAGQAEIFVADNVEMGNPTVKAMMYFGRANFAGVVLGAKAPLIVTSRSDSKQFKVNSISLGILLAP